MRLKKIMVFLSVFSFAFNSRAGSFSAVPQAQFEIQKIADVLQDVTSASAEWSQYQFRKEDKKQVELLTPKLMAHFKVRTVGGALVIEGEKVAAVLQIEDDKLLLNGTVLKINPGLPITQSLKNWALTNKPRKSASTSEWMLKQLVPRAYAQVDPIVLATAMTVGSGSLENLASNLMIATAISDTGAAAAGAGAAITTGTLAAVLAGILVLSVGTYALLECELAYPRKERLNCYSQPLSWVGLNPRDRLYLQGIECEKGVIRVQLESQTHNKSSRNFKFDDQGLHEIEEVAQVDGKRPEKSYWLDNVKATPESKAAFQKAQKEFSYYKQLCDDPAKKQAFEKIVATSKAARKVHTGETSAATLGNK